MSKVSEKPILITGSKGQLGTALTRLLTAKGVHCLLWDLPEHNLTDYQAVNAKIIAAQPSAIVNAAAYTQVDLAEKNQATAFDVNSHSVKNLGLICAEHQIRLIHISTDYVFNGEQTHHQTPADKTDPINVYGASKLAGEQALAKMPPLDWLCLRTAWVYSNQGHNFLNKMLEMMQNGQALRVITDQIGSPTSAMSLAQAVYACLQQPKAKGLMHFTNAGVASWYDFAKAIQTQALEIGLLKQAVPITPILTQDYVTPAKRPLVSMLSKASFLEQVAFTPAHWQDALKVVLEDRLHQATTTPSQNTCEKRKLVS